VTKILTWNIWFGAQAFNARATGLVREITARRPDVVALQEVRPEMRRILEHHVAGYELFGGDSMFGYDAMLMTRTGTAVGGDIVELPSRMGRRLLAVELANGLVVATVHLESTLPCGPERCAQLALIGPWLAARSENAILVGDMNFDDFDARESDVLDDSFVDVWPVLRAGAPGYTVDSKANTMRSELRSKVQKRIDRAFLRGPTFRATEIELVGAKPIGDHLFVSDHFGLAITLDP